MISAKVKSIGPEAIAKQDQLAILFDETATPDLKKIAVVQEIEKNNDQQFNLKAGSQIVIGEQTYDVEFVGSLVNQNLQSIGHTTLVFKDVPEQPLASAIYLSPKVFPDFKVGEAIQYK
ncbi:PTS glucitol/sorbitol transporter subunit IIA [Pediococcus acidilactici]